MSLPLKQFALALVAFMMLDGLWLGVVMRGFYRSALSGIGRMAPDGSFAPVWGAVLPVYILLALGECWFVAPRFAGGSVASAALWGGAFGLVTYGVYDFTNWSTLRTYGPMLALVDNAWGAFACAVVAVLLRLVRD
jgi:uncharacterized membrane protein